MGTMTARRAGIALGVNIDHVATLRQVRRATYPDPLHAALRADVIRRSNPAPSRGRGGV